jgi:hypothetical protein
MRYYGHSFDKWRMAEDPARCIVEVSATEAFGFYHQCSRKRGYGPSGLYCKQHANMIVKGKHVWVPEDE